MIELVTGYSVNWLLMIGYDWLLYPYAIYALGIVWGGIVMGVLSGLICLLMIRFYDWSRRDWLGIEAIKSFKTYGGNNIAAQLARWLMRKGNLLFFVFLSVRYDPFITMVYMRHGAFNGMTPRDWTIFLISAVISNAYWTLACYMGVSVVEWVWRIYA